MKPSRWVSFVVIFCLGAILGWALASRLGQIAESSKNIIVRQSESKYKFVSPLLAVGDFPNLKTDTGLEKEIRVLIENGRKDAGLIDASVYYRDNNSGHWMGVNEDELFAPASMLKVTILITYLRMAGLNPDLLDQEVIYKIDPTLRKAPAEIGSPTIEPGKTYTVSQLLQHMIIYSDNEATAVLDKMMSQQAKETIFTDLGLAVPNFDENTDSMSTKSFSLFFRILYNASYLSGNASEAALTLLTQTDFKNGIVDGLPPGTVVAHKYGHRVLTSAQNKIEELHDCGIIYQATSPYTLCIMTKGTNLNNLEAMIKKISQTVYAFSVKK